MLFINIREIPKIFLWVGYIWSACIIFLCKDEPIIVKLLKSDFSSSFFCSDPSHLRPSHYVFVYTGSFLLLFGQRTARSLAMGESLG